MEGGVVMTESKGPFLLSFRYLVWYSIKHGIILFVVSEFFKLFWALLAHQGFISYYFILRVFAMFLCVMLLYLRADHFPKECTSNFQMWVIEKLGILLTKAVQIFHFSLIPLEDSIKLSEVYTPYGDPWKSHTRNSFLVSAGRTVDSLQSIECDKGAGVSSFWWGCQQTGEPDSLLTEKQLVMLWATPASCQPSFHNTGESVLLATWKRLGANSFPDETPGAHVAMGVLPVSLSDLEQRTQSSLGPAPDPCKLWGDKCVLFLAIKVRNTSFL